VRCDPRARSLVDLQHDALLLELRLQLDDELVDDPGDRGASSAANWITASRRLRNSGLKAFLMISPPSVA
jgi:hypothetical protein